MLQRLLGPLLRSVAMKTGRLRGPWVSVCHPMGGEYAEYLRRHGGFHSMGKGCSIQVGTRFLDPAYVRLGNNVHFADCTLIGHDGAVAMLSDGLGIQVDAVGKIDIRDNVFVGYQAILLPGVTVGPNAIVASGAVVSKDVPPGTVVGGIPAKVIGTFDDYVRKLEERTATLPWAGIIRSRRGGFDPAVEPELVRQRVAHFFKDDPPTGAG